jgi:type IX secretion system PorP/SprF family membrane protein
MRLTLLLLLTMCFQQVLSQDPIFSQAYANRLYLNPALTGIENTPLVYAHYRNQWPALSVNFVTTTLAYDRKFQEYNSGVGFIAMHDQMGSRSVTQTSLGLNYSYELIFGDSIRMALGAQAVFAHKRVDWNQITFGDMIDPRLGFIFQPGDIFHTNGRNFWDISTGLALQWRGLFLGGSAHHLNTPNVSVIVGNSPLPMRFGFHGGYNIRVPLFIGEQSNIFTITPHMQYQRQQGFDMLVGGLYLNCWNVTLGAFARSTDAVSGILGYDFKFGRVAYSYDYVTSALTNASGGAHELSLSWRLGANRQFQGSREHEFPQF